MPNGLGAILAALAGGAKSYTNLKQREREEAIEAAEREYIRQQRKEAAEDRAARLAEEKFAGAKLAEALGYESQKVLQSRLAGLGDPPAYELGPFDLGLDGVASKPAVGSLKPSPFSGPLPGVIGQNPFGEAKAQEMIKNADNAEQRLETQRRLANVVNVPGQGLMYVTTQAEQLAAAERRKVLEEARVLAVTQDNARLARQEAELQAEKKSEVLKNLLTKANISEEKQALVQAGLPLSALFLTEYERQRLQLEKQNNKSLASVTERRAAGLYTGAKNALSALEKLIKDGYSPINESVLSRTAATVGANRTSRALASTRGKLFRNEVERLITNYLYTTSGATANAQEIKSQAEQTTTNLLDGPETFEQKMNFLRGKVSEMEIMAGRAAFGLDEAALSDEALRNIDAPVTTGSLYGGVWLEPKPKP